MPRISAGLLMYRVRMASSSSCWPSRRPVLSEEDEGHWSIPKGEQDDGEDLLVTASASSRKRRA